MRKFKVLRPSRSPYIGLVGHLVNINDNHLVDKEKDLYLLQFGTFSTERDVFWASQIEEVSASSESVPPEKKKGGAYHQRSKAYKELTCKYCQSKFTIENSNNTSANRMFCGKKCRRSYDKEKFIKNFPLSKSKIESLFKRKWTKARISREFNITGHKLDRFIELMNIFYDKALAVAHHHRTKVRTYKPKVMERLSKIKK